MFKLVSEKHVPLTRRLIEEVACMEVSRYERPKRPSRVRAHVEAILAGEFHGMVVAVAKMLQGDDTPTWRVNGQHTANAFMQIPDNKFPIGLYVTFKRFSVETMLDVSDLCATFDPPGSSKTRSDIIGAYFASDPMLDEIKKVKKQPIAYGVRFAIDGPEVSDADVYETGRMAVKEAPFCLFAAKHTGRNFLKRPAMIGAMFDTYRANLGRNKENTSRFWGRVQDEEVGKRAHPARRLNEFLKVDCLRRRYTNPPQPREVYYKCVVAWNAWAQGKKSVALGGYTVDTKLPRVIKIGG